MKFEDVKKTKYGMAYLISSCVIVILSIAVIIVACLTHAFWAMFVYLGFALAYAVCIFILEVLKGKGSKEEKAEEKQPAEEQPKEEEKPAEEEKVEEKPAEKEEKPQPKAASKPNKGKAAYVPFTERLKRSDPFVVFAYNEIKSELLSYGFRSRISQKGDSFRLHRKLYTRITVAGKTLKLYMALDPKEYENTTIPFKDASGMKKYEAIPFVFKAKSDLSIRRAKRLIEDMAGNDNIEQKKVVERNHTKEALTKK